METLVKLAQIMLPQGLEDLESQTQQRAVRADLPAPRELPWTLGLTSLHLKHQTSFHPKQREHRRDAVEEVRLGCS
jgi:hypothetical protein